MAAAAVVAVVRGETTEKREEKESERERERTEDGVGGRWLGIYP